MGCETEIDFRMDLVIGCVFWGWGGLDLLVCVCFYCGLFFFFCLMYFWGMYVFCVYCCGSWYVRILSLEIDTCSLVMVDISIGIEFITIYKGH